MSLLYLGRIPCHVEPSPCRRVSPGGGLGRTLNVVTIICWLSIMLRITQKTSLYHLFSRIVLWHGGAGLKVMLPKGPFCGQWTYEYFNLCQTLCPYLLALLSQKGVGENLPLLHKNKTFNGWARDQNCGDFGSFTRIHILPFKLTEYLSLISSSPSR